MPEKINWGELKIHAGFINEFLEIHKVKNLRTLEKAQHFFDDVKLFCSTISNERFMDEIRLICFAIVVESIDKLCYKESDENQKETSKQATQEIYNQIEHRIINYLRRIMSSRNLMVILLSYYQNGEGLSIDEINVEYKLFLKAGQKRNYYKTDKEIKEILPELREGMNTKKSLAELNAYADEYVVWSDIIGEDNSIVLREYRDKLHKMLLDIIQSGDESIMDYGDIVFHLSSEKIKQIYNEEVEEMRKLAVKNCIENLQIATKGNEAYEYSYQLRNYYKSSFYQDAVKEYATYLYNRKSFPVDDIDETQYHTCYNIMYVLCEADGDKFFQYCDKLSKECDHMSAHRIEVLVKEIVRGY